MRFAEMSWKFADIAYHNRSPAASRKSGKPNVCHGRRPTNCVQAAAALLPIWSDKPSLSTSGQGRLPGRELLDAALAIKACLASASALLSLRPCSLRTAVALSDVTTTAVVATPTAAMIPSMA